MAGRPARPAEHAADRHEQWLSDGRCIMIEERKTSDGGTIGLRVDITEMKQREESFRLLFESNPCRCWSMIRRGRDRFGQRRRRRPFRL
jgi:hypothetical protein